MRHEICHGLGLDHVNKQDELMYYGYSLDEEKVVTCGAQVGLQALHDICQPTPTPTPTNGGNYVSFDMTGSKLKWVTDEEEILGFNLYCAKDGKMISINDALILKNDLTEQYSYSILSEQKHAKLYLEVVQKNEICRIFAVN